MDTKIRILFCCTGLGTINRGFETFFREAFDELSKSNEILANLLKGGNDLAASSVKRPDEYVLPCLNRNARLAKFVAKITKRTPYAVEQWSAFPAVVYHILRFRPHIVFYSELNLGFLLHRFRKLIPAPFKLLYSNGGPCAPPFPRCDFVHQVAPVYYQQAINSGEAMGKHYLVPYGFQVPQQPLGDEIEKANIRKQLGLPLQRPIILSVGWISRAHKRMDYLIDEVAKLPSPRPFLQLVGSMDENSTEVINHGIKILGADNFSALSTPKEKVTLYYQASDVFALASLSEGFGRVYIESLMHGLPTIAHRNSLTESLLKNAGNLVDLSQEGGLTKELEKILSQEPINSNEGSLCRRKFAATEYSWSVLKQQYLAMFKSISPSA